ncbi:uncharacterized protein MONOS_10279 [Monocercomonoides exilis]|uniref:uncharacterized protein n=1 Tax=Monocercomonoides exilis TaxID=2049356 RepID=UPI003559AEC2|nr:hypothetical protein MONOS_10279 [Monocercomonoides exilis]|eukprot:MONOS_10279.1-p1 / transcript=MONOS_10279.1 / gene=MONOS_10279 / organism=Monocercomonoides_exilis_PA203 / gene_product=unspecified product / transcript_product=unspecified product / location=Mono_scaffold00460:27677-29239(+) / protein_length=430 / sequence_SO=supercontig / SO=protein_coding / is_pseudo=false
METDNTKKFNKLFYELEHCRKDKQRKKIGEMNEIIDEMNEEEHKFVFKTELYNKMNKMIEKKKMSMENATWMLKHIGYCKVLKDIWNTCFEYSESNSIFEEMIFYENKKKEGKNEKLLIDLCECYLLLNRHASSELIPISVPYLLKAASVKDESEETQKEVEMALLALSCVDQFYDLRQELYLNDTKEIIKYHQEHRNFTKLAYQRAWEFLINRLRYDRSFEDMIVNELHFVGEATRELEELAINDDWNRKKGEEGGIKTKKELILLRWLHTIVAYFCYCHLRNEENVVLIDRISYVFRAANDNHRGIGLWYSYPLINAVENRAVKVDALLKGRAIDAVLERMQRPKLDDEITVECLQFLKNVSNRLEEEEKDEKEEEERKATKRKVFEKMEEEGYEDTITSFHETLKIFNRRYYHGLSLKFSDYLVNV